MTTATAAPNIEVSTSELNWDKIDEVMEEGRKLINLLCEADVYNGYDNIQAVALQAVGNYYSYLERFLERNEHKLEEDFVVEIKRQIACTRDALQALMSTV